MLLVIFGAGASYDSFGSEPPKEFDWQRPPLAARLFTNHEAFRRVSKNYPHCQALIPLLEITPEGEPSVEEILERFQAEAVNDPHRHSQLMAIRYYLRDVITNCWTQWNNHTNGVTNFKLLLDYTRRHHRTALVTFNYDRFLEDAFLPFNRTLERTSEYIQGPHAIYKLHGSTHWENLVEFSRFNGNRGAPQTPQELIDHAAWMKATDYFRVQNESGWSSISGMAWAPAIAIPVVSKKVFACPQSHIEVLRNTMPEISKILVIGWRGAEQHFLNLLRGRLKEDIPTMIVCGSLDENVGTADRMRAAGLKIHPEYFDGGFSAFVRSRQCEMFLKVVP